MIPVNEPILGEREKELLVRCIDEKSISSAGLFVKKFEKDFSRYVGRNYGVAVCNGTAALELALKALGLKLGDEVILPAFTIISCALAVIRLGAIPVLVDAEKDSWNMDVSQIEAKITKKTKAIMPVHIYGHPVDMDSILNISKKYRLFVIEDAAEAHGAEYKGEKCGSFGDISIFSFYANKVVTTGEGGMILTNDKTLAERAKSLRNLCFNPERRFYHKELGYNYRMSNLQAAVGLAQLEKIENFIKIKRNNAKRYYGLLKDLTQVHLPVERKWAKSIFWMYGIVLDKKLGLSAGEFSRRLYHRGIETRPFFLGMHEQPVFKKMDLFKEESYPITEDISNYGLYLPSGLAIREEQIIKVSKAVRQSLIK